MDKLIENRKIAGYILTGILVSGVLLRLISLGSKCFYSDEGTTWFIALGEISSDAHPPLYFWILEIFIKILGWSEYAGRLPSVIFGIFSVPIFYMIGNKFFDRKTGFYAALLTGISAFLILVSQEMRMYSLLGFETVLALWFFLNILVEERPGFKWWMGFILISVAALYTHSVYAFLLLYFGLTILVYGWRGYWNKFGLFILSALVIVAAYIPQLIDIVSKAGIRQHVFAASLWHIKVNILRIVKSFVGFLYGNYFINLPGSAGNYMMGHPGFTFFGILMLAVFLVMFFVGAKYFIGRIKAGSFRSPAPLVLAGMIIFSILLFTVMDVSTARQMIFIYIPFVFIIAVFFADVQGRWKNLILGSFLFLTAIALVDYYRRPYFAYERADWREAGQVLKQNLAPNDKIFFVQPRNGYYTMKFYVPYMLNEVYYRSRPDYPDNKPGHHQLLWSDRTKPASDWVKEMAEQNQRLWVVGLRKDWYDETYYNERYSVEIFSAGVGFELHLYQHVTGLNPLNSSEELF